jgi:hypothetical protein
MLFLALLRSVESRGRDRRYALFAIWGCGDGAWFLLRVGNAGCICSAVSKHDGLGDCSVVVDSWIFNV